MSMRRRDVGWRSARTTGSAAPVAPPAPSPAPSPARSPARSQGALAGNLAATMGWPWQGVTWSLSYAAFLLYVVGITTYAIRLGDVTMAIALFGLALLGGGLRVPPVLLWMGAFLAWCAVGGLQSAYPSLVQKEVINFGKLWLIGLVAANALRTKSNIRLFTVLFLACYALYPTRGAILNYLGGYTVFGRALWNYIYANPNDLAALTLLQFSIAVSLVRTEFHRWTRYCVLLGCAVLPVLILMTQSRGAFIALAFFLALYLVGQRRRARAVAIIAAIGVIVVMISPSGVWKRVSGLRNATSEAGVATVDREGSAKQRYEIWRVARAMIVDHPAFGVGLGAYPNEHARYVSNGGFHRTARGSRDTHSTYLNVAAETGFIGLLFFVGMLASAVVTAERTRRRWRHAFPDAAQQLYALELGLAAYLVAGIFGSFAKLSFFYLHLILLVAVARQLEVAAAAAGAARAEGGAVRGMARGRPAARGPAAAADLRAGGVSGG